MMSRLNRPVILISVATAFSLLGDMVLYAVLPVPFYHQKLGLEPYHIGLLLSVNRWIRMVTNHLAERLTQRFNTTYLVAAALTLGSALALVYATVTLFPILLLARACWGLCWSFIRQIGMVTVVDSVSDGRFARSMGYYNGISRAGGAFGLFVGALLCDHIGFSATLIAFGLLSLVAVLPGVMSQRSLDHYRLTPSSSRATKPIGAGAALLACGFIVRCVSSIIMTTLGMALAERVGTSITIGGVILGVATLNGILLAGRWITDSVGAPFLGALTDRLGYWRSAFAFFVIGTCVLLPGAYVASTLLLICLVLIFFVCATTLALTLAAEAGRKGSRAIASYVTSADIGSAAGPLLGWTVLEFLPEASVMFIIGAALFSLAGCVSLLVLRTQHATNGEGAQGS
jgi:predicted MFS family arabinose efflux permease